VLICGKNPTPSTQNPFQLISLTAKNAKFYAKFANNKSHELLELAPIIFVLVVAGDLIITALETLAKVT
jgi:hypothetical protein